MALAPVVAIVLATTLASGTAAARRDGYPANRVAVAVGRALTRPVRALPSVKVIGAEHVSGVEGSVVLAGNHISNLDAPVIALASPKTVRWMAKVEVFRVPVVGAIVRAMGAFPVDRVHVDKEELSKRSGEALAGDEALGIFVEGGFGRRTPAQVTEDRAALDRRIAKLAGDPSKAKLVRKLEYRRDVELRPSVLFGGKTKRGAAYQAVEHDRPVVPTLLVGTRKLYDAPKRAFYRVTGRRPPDVPPKRVGLKVVFGEPIYPDPALPRPARVKALQGEIDSALRAMGQEHMKPGQTEVW